MHCGMRREFWPATPALAYGMRIAYQEIGALMSGNFNEFRIGPKKMLRGECIRVVGHDVCQRQSNLST